MNRTGLLLTAVALAAAAGLAASERGREGQDGHAAGHGAHAAEASAPASTHAFLAVNDRMHRDMFARFGM